MRSTVHWDEHACEPHLKGRLPFACRGPSMSASTSFCCGAGTCRVFNSCPAGEQTFGLIGRWQAQVVGSVCFLKSDFDFIKMGLHGVESHKALLRPSESGLRKKEVSPERGVFHSHQGAAEELRRETWLMV